MTNDLIKPVSNIHTGRMNFQAVNTAGRQGHHLINQVSVDPMMTGNSDCYEFKRGSGLYSITFRWVTQFSENSGAVEGRDAKSDEVDVQSSVKPGSCPEDEELEWDPYLSGEFEAFSVERDSSSMHSWSSFQPPLSLHGDKKPRAFSESTSSLNSASESSRFSNLATGSLNDDICESQNGSELFLCRKSFDTHPARDRAVSGQSELPWTTLVSNIEPMDFNTVVETDYEVTLNTCLSSLSIYPDQEGDIAFESKGLPDSNLLLTSSCQESDIGIESNGCPITTSQLSGFSEVSSVDSSADAGSIAVNGRYSDKKRGSGFWGSFFGRFRGHRNGAFTNKLGSGADTCDSKIFSRALRREVSRDSGVSGCSESVESSLSSSLSSSTGTDSGLLIDGNKIRTTAGIIGDKNRTVKASAIVFEQLNTYDLNDSPAWYNEKIHSRVAKSHKRNVQYWMFNHFSSLLGWDCKNKHILLSKKDDLVLQPSFLMYFENDADAFTSFAGVKTLMTNLKRTVANKIASSECCPVKPGSTYEVLTWKKEPDDLKNHIKINAGVDFNSDIHAACWFFVRRMCEIMIDSYSSKSSKFSKKSDKLHKNLESCQINKKLGSGYSVELLKSCVDFNLAVQMIDDYGYSSGLVPDPRCRDDDKEIVQYYESRKEDLSRVGLQKNKKHLDFSSLNKSDLLTIESLESIMDALEKEAIEIKESMSKSIERVAVDLEGKTFEEKVLGLKKNDSGDYIIEPFIAIRKRLKIIKDQISTGSQSEFNPGTQGRY